ncbi:serine hydrolase domain-containing protein [Microbacterium terricola]|uniref:Serine hydrolase n=1 Tax=Microbacterium terricola TaxID=344163 RepID=A0ABM8E0X4_9MICO|nr:serine hydrolase domain-containing protein [Microbacterium terricola]UYK40816.1 beta-lactamase family protein [Microbacterium terricola]BDV31436.1 serine hydrolase [Microbacterium terricola]
MRLDTQIIDAAAAAEGFSGVVTVDTGARRVFGRAYGFAHRAFGIVTAPEMQFAVASGSKTFTALAVLRLVAQGELELDQPVRGILGDDLPLIDAAVTIGQLLSHTSGIGDYLDEDTDWAADDYILTAPVHTLTTAEAFLPLIDGFPQKSAPGERFAYCNGGYIVLAIVIERVTGETYHDVVRRLVFAPAGLAHTDFLRLDELPSTAAVGYLYATGDRANTLHLPVIGNGDGGAFTTAGDLHRFWRAFHAGAIVSTETVAQMTAPTLKLPKAELAYGMDYGMGLWLHTSGRAVVMEGYDAGVSFASTHIPAAATTVSVLGNSSEGARPVIAAVDAAITAELG